jgi:hypothetical protein
VPNGERLGNLFAESVNLAIEQGVTRTSGTAGVVTMNNSIASVNKQCTVDAAAIIMQCVLSWDTVAKARQPNSAQSFENAMTQVVDNVLLSHRRHQTADMLYGGDNIGVISAGTASATQTLSKASCAPGIWYGSTGMLVDIYDPTLATKRNASPLSVTSFAVDPTGASRTVTFGASVTTTTNDVVVFSGTVPSQAFITPPGLSIIAGQTGGTLFGLSQSTYPVFQGATFDAGSAALNMKALDQASALPLIRGYTGRLKLLVNPITFSNISMEETARVQLVGNKATGTAEIGFDEVRITSSTGANLSCVGSPWIKEGSNAQPSLNVVNSGKLLQRTILIQAPSGEGATTIPAMGVRSSEPKRDAAAIQWLMIWSDLASDGECESSDGDSEPSSTFMEAYLVPDDGSVKRIGAVDIQLGGPADPAPTWRRIEGSTGYSLPTYSLSAMFSAEPWKLTKIKNIVNV